MKSFNINGTTLSLALYADVTNSKLVFLSLLGLLVLSISQDSDQLACDLELNLRFSFIMEAI